MSPKTINTYFANLQQIDDSSFFIGGNVLPPNIDTETDVDIRCPDDRNEKMKAAICRVLTVNQFGQDTLLFHGTCDPNAVPFPNAIDHDNLRWYAFEPNMSLDFIKEESGIRAQHGLDIGVPTLFVYRIKRPIRNLLLFADTEQWQDMGGQEHLLRREVCNVKIDLNTQEGQLMQQRAHQLGCPLAEYAMAARAKRFKIIRGNRGEECKGWVRLNAIGIQDRKRIPKPGFELALTASQHEDYVELVDSFTVSDDPARYGTIPKETNRMEALDWHLTDIIPDDAVSPALVNRRKSLPMDFVLNKKLDFSNVPLDTSTVPNCHPQTHYIRRMKTGKTICARKPGTATRKSPPPRPDDCPVQTHYVRRSKEGKTICARKPSSKRV
jgi:hypothetical protein